MALERAIYITEVFVSFDELHIISSRKSYLDLVGNTDADQSGSRPFLWGARACQPWGGARFYINMNWVYICIVRL